MPHWKSLQGKEFLGSWDFEQGEEKIVTITGFSSEIIKNPQDPSRNDKPRVVLDFAECKRAVMNTTNCTMISEVLGSPDINDWIGKKIVLHTEKVRGFGKLTDAIRVMDKKPSPMVCECCKNEITAAGSWTAEQVANEAKKRFKQTLCAKCFNEKVKEVKEAANVETDA